MLSFLSSSISSVFIFCSAFRTLAGTFEALGCRCPIGAGSAAKAVPDAAHIRSEIKIKTIERIWTPWLSIRTDQRPGCVLRFAEGLPRPPGRRSFNHARSNNSAGAVSIVRHSNRPINRGKSDIAGFAHCSTDHAAD